MLKNYVLPRASAKLTATILASCQVVRREQNECKPNISQLRLKFRYDCAAFIRLLVENHRYEVQSCEDPGQVTLEGVIMTVYDEDSARVAPLLANSQHPTMVAYETC